MWWYSMWGALENLIFAPLIIGMLILLIYRLRRTRTMLNLLTSPRWRSLLIRHTSYKKYLLKIVLLMCAILFLFVGLLRPQWDTKEQHVMQEGRDLFIALDISRSMLATDCQPNRLSVAKSKIKRLLPLLSCERVGLILFAGSSLMQCPLTTDHEAFKMFLVLSKSEYCNVSILVCMYLTGVDTKAHGTPSFVI